MKKIQNQPALAIVVLGLLLGLSIGKIYQQQLRIHQIQKEAKTSNLELVKQLYEQPAPSVDELNQHERKLEKETERIKEEMARLQAELEKVQRAHEELLDTHMRRLGRAQ